MICLVLFVLMCGTTMGQTMTESWLEAYNVIWDASSRDSSESMPCGGGDIGLNVWVEDGEVLFYMQRSGSLAETNEYLKLGRVRLRLEPSEPRRRQGQVLRPRLAGLGRRCVHSPEPTPPFTGRCSSPATWMPFSLNSNSTVGPCPVPGRGSGRTSVTMAPSTANISAPRLRLGERTPGARNRDPFR